jgi:hypothetical protein
MMPLIGFALYAVVNLTLGAIIGIALARADASRRLTRRARRLQGLADDERAEHQRIEALPADQREGQDLALELTSHREHMAHAKAWALYHAADALDRAPVVLFWRPERDEVHHG